MYIAREHSHVWETAPETPSTHLLPRVAIPLPAQGDAEHGDADADGFARHAAVRERPGSVFGAKKLQYSQ